MGKFAFGNAIVLRRQEDLTGIPMTVEILPKWLESWCLSNLQCEIAADVAEQVSEGHTAVTYIPHFMYIKGGNAKAVKKQEAGEETSGETCNSKRS